MLRKKTFHFIAAVVLSTIIILLQSLQETPKVANGDTYNYLSIAKELYDKGIFTDGGFRNASVVQGPNEEGMFFAPLYPAFITAVMYIDPTFKNTVTCHMSSEQRESCPDNFGLLYPIQIGLAILSIFLIWVSGLILTERYSIAWIAMILGALANGYTFYTSVILTESFVFPLFTAACLSSLCAWKYKKGYLWFLTGIFLGLVSLTRPTFTYLFYAYIPVLIVLFICRKNFSLRKKLVWPFVFIFGFIVTAGPWIIRNGTIMGEYAISKGYAPYVLSQRVAYNDMTWKEWAISFIYGLPDFGDSLSEKFFSRENYERFEYDNKKGFFWIGHTTLKKETLEKAGSRENHLSWLIKHEIIDNLYKHVMVTFSLTWRGMWICKYWGLLSIPLFFCLFIWALRKGWLEFLLFSIPPWFMLGLHAFTSVNVTRYNLILIPALAISVAFILNEAFMVAQKKYFKSKVIVEK